MQMQPGKLVLGFVGRRFFRCFCPRVATHFTKKTKNNKLRESVIFLHEMEIPPGFESLCHEKESKLRVIAQPQDIQAHMWFSWPRKTIHTHTHIPKRVPKQNKHQAWQSLPNRSLSRDPYIIHLNIALQMVVSLYFGGKSHVSNGQNVSFKEPV